MSLNDYIIEDLIEVRGTKKQQISNTAEAMEQIHKCRYYDKYRGEGEITLLAIIFDENKRNIGEYTTEKI